MLAITLDLHLLYLETPHRRPITIVYFGFIITSVTKRSKAPHAFGGSLATKLAE